MSSGFSNTDTGSKPADPYTAKNEQDPDLKTKVTDLLNFADKQKFCMMTTVTPNHLLASRCMALAGKVRAPTPGPTPYFELIPNWSVPGTHRKATA